MLRITSSDMGQDRVLQLEGKICRQWAGELCTQNHSALTGGHKIILAFTQVIYIDEEAGEMLSRFSAEQLEKKNCSLYIRTLFDQQRRP